MQHKKIFKHNLVPSINVNTEMIDNKRYYVLDDGTKLKSVTTVLGEQLDKTALEEWKARVGEVEAKKISTQAATRGTAIHRMAEKYLLNEDNIYMKEMPVNIETFSSIRKALDKHVDNIQGIELPLYNKTLKCAGRTDLVAEFDGVLSIIDFKTSKKLKEEDWIESYFLQSTVYSMMFEWIYKFAVPQIVIIIAVDHEPNPQIFKMDRSKYVNRVLEIFYEK